MVIQQYEMKKITLTKIGLNNLGETCYMNSAIQILLHIKKFMEKLIKLVNPFIKNITYNFIVIANSLIKIENDINEEFLSKSYSPVYFTKSFQKIYTQFQKGQQDAIEFIRTILDDISKESKKHIIIRDYEELDLEGKSKKIQISEYYKFF